MKERIIDRVAFKQIAAPVNAKGVGITGSEIELKEGHSVFAYFSMTETLDDASASATGVVTINFKQSNGTDVKDLSVNGHYFYRASDENKFTKVAFEGSSITVDALAVKAGQLYIEIPAELLDVNNGYKAVRVDVADTVENKTIAGVYGLHIIRHGYGYEVEC